METLIKLKELYNTSDEIKDSCEDFNREASFLIDQMEYENAISSLFLLDMMPMIEYCIKTFRKIYLELIDVLYVYGEKNSTELKNFIIRTAGRSFLQELFIHSHRTSLQSIFVAKLQSIPSALIPQFINSTMSNHVIYQAAPQISQTLASSAMNVISQQTIQQASTQITAQTVASISTQSAANQVTSQVVQQAVAPAVNVVTNVVSQQAVKQTSIQFTKQSAMAGAKPMFQQAVKHSVSNKKSFKKLIITMKLMHIFKQG